MSSGNEEDRTGIIDALKSTTIVLMFGLLALGFLVAIDRPHWFQLRPVSGMSSAMANAADKPLVRADSPL